LLHSGTKGWWNNAYAVHSIDGGGSDVFFIKFGFPGQLFKVWVVLCFDPIPTQGFGGVMVLEKTK
jgi:hypothetical protein